MQKIEVDMKLPYIESGIAPLSHWGLPETIRQDLTPQLCYLCFMRFEKEAMPMSYFPALNKGVRSGCLTTAAGKSYPNLQKY